MKKSPSLEQRRREILERIKPEVIAAARRRRVRGAAYACAIPTVALLAALPFLRQNTVPQQRPAAVTQATPLAETLPRSPHLVRVEIIPVNRSVKLVQTVESGTGSSVKRINDLELLDITRNAGLQISILRTGGRATVIGINTPRPSSDRRVFPLDLPHHAESNAPDRRYSDT